MKTKIQKWGNSLAIRIPRGFASEAQVKQGSAVSLSMDDGRLVIAPVRKFRHNLGELVRAISKKNLHEETRTGKKAGREIW